MLDQSTALPMDIFLRPRDVAARTGYSVSTLARWRCQGEGPVFRKVNRACVYRWGDVLEWLGSPRHSTSDQTSRPTCAA
jgi:predicted DNA-binding transcriptional regulator AlpA